MWLHIPAVCMDSNLDIMKVASLRNLGVQQVPHFSCNSQENF